MEQAPPSYTTGSIQGEAKVIQGNINNIKLYLEQSKGSRKLDPAALCATNPSDDLSSLRVEKRPTEKTCAWIFESKEFENWRNFEKIPVLVITGDPGIGKTSLSTFLVDCLSNGHPRLNFTPVPKVAHFFCDAQKENHNSAIAILGGLLFQLCQDQDLSKHVQERFKEPKEDILHSFNALWGAFEDILADPKTGHRVFVIDAIDECGKSSCKEFLEYLDNWLQSRAHNHHCNESKAKFIITCRHQESVRPFIHQHGDEEDASAGALRSPYHSLHICSERIKEELRYYISQEVSRIAFGWEPKMKEDVETKLRERSGGTFLWVHLAISQLREVHTNQVYKTLNRIPKKLSSLYDNMLQNIPRDFLGDATFVFQVIIAARSPFTKDQLLLAYYLEKQQWAHQLPPLSQRVYMQEDHILKICSNFLSIQEHHGSKYVQFIHESLREHLLQGTSILAPVSFGSRLKPVLSIFASINALSLLWFLVPWWLPWIGHLRPLLPQPDQTRVGWPSTVVCIVNSFILIALGCISFSSISERLGRGVLPSTRRLPYRIDISAAHYLLFRISFAVLGFLDAEHVKDQSLNSLLAYSTRELHFHAIRSNPISMRYFLRKNRDLNEPHQRLDRWLRLVARTNHESTSHFMRSLFKTGARMEAKSRSAMDGFSTTILSDASSSGNLDAVKLLLTNGADVHAQDERGWTPLRYAVAGRHPKIVQALIAAGANPDVKDARNETALLSLVSDVEDYRLHPGQKFTGDKFVVLGEFENYSRETTARVETLGDSQNRNRTLDTAAILARATKNINLADSNGRTTLLRAAKVNQLDLVNLLMNSGANVNIEDDQRMTPLLCALRYPRQTTEYRDISIENKCKALIGPCYYRDSSGRDGQEPFHQDVWQDKGNLLIIEDLISRTDRTTIQARDYTGRTALSLAAESGLYKIVELLLDRGADASIEDTQGLTPLMWACKRKLFRQTYYTGCQVRDTATAIFGKFLIWIVASRDEEVPEEPKETVPPEKDNRNSIVQLLLDKGVPINSASKEDITALDYAILHGFDSTAQFLRDKGAVSKYAPNENNRTVIKPSGGAETWLEVRAEDVSYQVNGSIGGLDRTEASKEIVTWRDNSSHGEGRQINGNVSLIIEAKTGSPLLTDERMSQFRQQDVEFLVKEPNIPEGILLLIKSFIDITSSRH